MADRITFEPVTVASEGQSEGRLVFLDGKLVAVVTRLDETHEDLQGRWFADASFNGFETMQHETFADLGGVASWIMDRAS